MKAVEDGSAEKKIESQRIRSNMRQMSDINDENIENHNFMQSTFYLTALLALPELSEVSCLVEIFRDLDRQFPI